MNTNVVLFTPLHSKYLPKKTLHYQKKYYFKLFSQAELTTYSQTDFKYKSTSTP